MNKTKNYGVNERKVILNPKPKILSEMENKKLVAADNRNFLIHYERIVTPVSRIKKQLNSVLNDFVKSEITKELYLDHYESALMAKKNGISYFKSELAKINI